MVESVEGAPPKGAKRKVPKYRTRTLWGVLTGLFLAGLASFLVGIWALTLAWGGGLALLWVPLGAAGMLGAIFCLLLTLGIVYRVDRLKGNLTRRVEMFE